MPTKFGVFWALKHAISLAPGGVGGPIIIATLQRSNCNWIAAETNENQEMEEYITALETHIGSFARQAIADAAVEPIPVPTPPAN